MNVLYDLEPEKEYCVAVQKGEEKSEIVFCTEAQDYTLNVRDFGAKGDGIQDDTTYIQAAIMACPKNSRVLIPEGVYRITSLFFKKIILQWNWQKGQSFRHAQSVRKFPVLKGNLPK